MVITCSIAISSSGSTPGFHCSIFLSVKFLRIDLKIVIAYTEGQSVPANQEGVKKEGSIWTKASEIASPSDSSEVTDA